MSNYSRFSGFKEGESLPPNTYVCVIQSERPTLGGKVVTGERGVAYSVKDEPENLYVIGDGWYWRGPKSETKRFEVAYKSPTLTIGGTLLGDSLLEAMKTSLNAAMPYYYSSGYVPSHDPFKDPITFKVEFDGHLPKVSKK